MPKGVFKRTEKNKKHLYAYGKPFEYKCIKCGVIFNATPSSKRKFCSRKCKESVCQKKEKHPMWKGGEKIYECFLCKKIFKRKPANVKKNVNVFCSCRCQAIWKCKHQKNKRTNIEIKMAAELTSAGIEYIEQVVYPKIGIPDFYLPKYNLAIFCDGEYWHNYPEGKERDRKQIIMLQEIGVNAVRLWGKQILEEEPLRYIEKFL